MNVVHTVTIDLGSMQFSTSEEFQSFFRSFSTGERFAQYIFEQNKNGLILSISSNFFPPSTFELIVVYLNEETSEYLKTEYENFRLDQYSESLKWKTTRHISYIYD